MKNQTIQKENEFLRTRLDIETRKNDDKSVDLSKSRDIED
jgi:hypothetical protein